RRDGLQLIKHGSMLTPTGAMDAGVIYDPEMLGKEMKGLVNDLKLNGKQVVSAVTGQQVYTRNLILPSMKLNELKEVVHYQAMNFLPIPVEEAAIDIFPLREFEDEEGKKTEVFFVAVRRQQVENLEIACTAAGLKLAVVEIEPLALFRVLGENSESVIAFLELGSSRSYFAVFKGAALVFYRSLPLGSSALYQILSINSMYGQGGFEEVEVKEDKQYDYLVRDIISEMKRSMEYYEIQDETGNEEIDKFLLCGRGSAIRGLDSRLTEGLGFKVEVADISPRIILPTHISEAKKRELKHEFTVALGLAAREVV
ncbi:MAG: type IV pilus assembly protein PilM, partial [Syntrophomonas sp.]|nr:type IV pilus assembly protein PilM [Syntrophomonas sp.]